MKFFHVYNDDCLKGLEKNNLINKDTGFKIQHCFAVPKERLFNNYAAVGGKLHSILKENKYPFYVDRLAGGVTYYPYAFDKNLIRTYQEMLGDEFLGFQLHESTSNIRDSDWVSLRNKMGCNGPYDVEELRKKFVSSFAFTPDGDPLYGFSHGRPEDYATRTYPETISAFINEAREMFLQRMKETDNNILPVDSFYMFTKLQDELGMRTFMPEVGWQISREREQVAVARGVAKASKKKWGTYYECWRADIDENGGINCCMPCYNLDPINEWYLTQETHGDDFTTHGANGGSSRLLQNRIYYHSLMSGADYLSEEWGLNCSYTDMQDFTLSAYGETKKAFIDTALDLQGVKSMTPFAIVLPQDYYCVEVLNTVRELDLGVRNGMFLNTPLTADEKEYYGHIEDVLSLFFERNCEAFGAEGHVITNSRFGDVVDIIYADASDETFAQYAYLIDATKDGSFARATAGSNLRILESGDIDKLTHEVDKRIEETMPVWVDSLCWLVSTDNKGRRFLSIFNNEGNTRTTEHGDVIDHKADRTVKISTKNPVNFRVFKAPKAGASITKKDDNTYYAEVPAAEFLILEF